MYCPSSKSEESEEVGLEEKVHRARVGDNKSKPASDIRNKHLHVPRITIHASHTDQGSEESMEGHKKNKKNKAKAKDGVVHKTGIKHKNDSKAVLLHLNKIYESRLNQKGETSGESEEDEGTDEESEEEGDNKGDEEESDEGDEEETEGDPEDKTVHTIGKEDSEPATGITYHLHRRKTSDQIHDYVSENIEEDEESTEDNKATAAHRTGKEEEKLCRYGCKPTTSIIHRSHKEVIMYIIREEPQDPKEPEPILYKVGMAFTQELLDDLQQGNARRLKYIHQVMIEKELAKEACKAMEHAMARYAFARERYGSEEHGRVGWYKVAPERKKNFIKVFHHTLRRV